MDKTKKRKKKSFKQIIKQRGFVANTQDGLMGSTMSYWRSWEPVDSPGNKVARVVHKE